MISPKMRYLQAVDQVATAERVAAQCDEMGLHKEGEEVRRSVIQRFRGAGIIEPVLQRIWIDGQISYMEYVLQARD